MIVYHFNLSLWTGEENQNEKPKIGTKLIVSIW